MSVGIKIASFTIKNKTFEAVRLEPALYLAATPIGNLGDITIRVLEALAGANLVACEDTRVTGKLLSHFAIKTPTTSYHEHNADIVGEKLLEKIALGEAIVLTSDAGTPLVSDPGFRLVVAARERGIRVVPLPGASAPLAALTASGLPSTRWSFSGFLPNKQGARISQLQALSSNQTTLIFFESPNRLVNTLKDMSEIFGKDRLACVARELTKLHEEICTGPICELLRRFEDKAIKGEIVILVSPAEDTAFGNPTELLVELLRTMTVKEAAAEAVEYTGLPKRELYQLALSIKEKRD